LARTRAARKANGNQRRGAVSFTKIYRSGNGLPKVRLHACLLVCQEFQYCPKKYKCA